MMLIRIHPRYKFYGYVYFYIKNLISFTNIIVLQPRFYKITFYSFPSTRNQFEYNWVLEIADDFFHNKATPFRFTQIEL